MLSKNVTSSNKQKRNCDVIKIRYNDEQKRNVTATLIPDVIQRYQNRTYF